MKLNYEMTLLFGHFVRANCHLTRVFWHCVKDPALIATQPPTEEGLSLDWKEKGWTMKYFGDDDEDGSAQMLWNHFVMFVQRCRLLLTLNLHSWWLSFQDSCLAEPVLWSRHNVRSRRPPDIINNPAIRPRWPMPPCYRHFLNRHSRGATDWKKPK